MIAEGDAARIRETGRVGIVEYVAADRKHYDIRLGDHVLAFWDHEIEPAEGLDTTDTGQVQ